jgi:cobalt-zinc-cadmium efflux system outer membrane protein
MRRVVLPAVLGWLGTLGCVARDAGYDDVRRTTAERIGKDVRWHEMDGGGAVAKRTRDILGKPLTADSAVELALLNNSGLEAAFEDLGIARAEIVQALALPNPSAEVALRFHPSSRPEITLRALESLSQLLFVPLRNGVAHSRLEAAQASVAGTILDVAFETRRAFYEYQAAVQVLELRRTVLSATHASFEAAERIHDAGNSTDLTLANERALYEESRILQTRAEGATVAAHEKVRALLGISSERDTWRIEGRLPEPPALEPPIEGVEERALARSLDLEILKHRLEAAKRKANLSRVEGLLPDLRVGAEAEREEHWTVGPAAAISIPLFYQGQGEVGAALADMRRQRASYAHTAARIRAAVRSATARLVAARTNANYYRTVLVPLRLQIVNDTELEYNAMVAGVFQLLQAKRDQIETARAYVEQLRDYWTARSDVDELAAGRLVRAPMGAETREAIPSDVRPSGEREP